MRTENERLRGALRALERQLEEAQNEIEEGKRMAVEAFAVAQRASDTARRFEHRQRLQDENVPAVVEVKPQHEGSKERIKWLRRELAQARHDYLLREGARMTVVNTYGERHQPKLSAEHEKYSSPSSVCSANVKKHWSSSWMPT